MKRKTIIFLTMFLIVLTPYYSYATSPELTLTSTNNLNSLKIGDSFTVDINLENANDFVGSKLIILFDPTTLSVTSKTINIENITDFSNSLDETWKTEHDSNGKTMLIFGLNKDIPPISGNISIGNIVFNALNKGNGNLSFDETTKIIYENEDGTIGEIPFTPFDLAYSIQGVGNLSGNISLADGSSSEGILVNLCQDNQVIYSEHTSTDGAFSFNDIFEGTYTIDISYEDYKSYNTEIVINNGQSSSTDITLFNKADITEDGVIDVEDLAYAASIFGMTSDNTNWSIQGINADMNDDEIINLIDLIYINRRICR